MLKKTMFVLSTEFINSTQGFFARSSISILTVGLFGGIGQPYISDNSNLLPSFLSAAQFDSFVLHQFTSMLEKNGEIEIDLDQMRFSMKKSELEDLLKNWKKQEDVLREFTGDQNKLIWGFELSRKTTKS
jgi:hypothetical protein